MRRIGLISRIILFLMVLILTLVVSAFGFDQWRRTHWHHPVLRRASHMAQAAGIMDTVLRAKPEDLTTVLRAVSGEVMRADILDAPPAQGRLVEAPHVAAKVASLMHMPAEGLRAFTDGNQRGLAYPGEGLEGVLRRAVLPLRSGRLLVVGVIVFVPDYSFKILGFSSGFWIGLLGFLVAGFALAAAVRELAPLRRLTEAVTRFDGRSPQAMVAEDAASEIGRLVHAVGDMQRRIADLLRERSFLVGGISHDAKTFLTRLRLRVEAVGDPACRAALVQDVDAMTDLIETSLAFARGTTAADQRQPVDLADLVAVEFAEREALGTKALLSCRLPAEARVNGDAVALRRVVANLVDNAIKFGSHAVDLDLSVADGVCRMVVDDDGPGIAPHERARIFDPFYRVEKSRSRQTGGTGPGLAIARQILEAHGGTIDIADSPSRGARFVVALPALPAIEGAARLARSG